MKKILLSALIIGLFCVAGWAQKIAKPTLTPKPSTDSQRLLINEGVKLHDSKKYSEAVAKYEQVLAENPDNTVAIYELAMSHFTMGNKVKAMETAHRGSKYKSDELALFYGVMANVVDDVGKPLEAEKIYRDAIKILGDDKENFPHLSELHYNLAVTYVRQKKYTEARPELKKAVEFNHKYPSPHFLIALVYNGTKYKIPAMVSAARLISLEFNSARTKQAADIISGILKAPQKDSKTGNINLFMDLNAPKDEGDFGMYDLMLGTLMIANEKEDKGKSENELFAEALDSLFAMITEDKKLKATFIGKNYVPFLADMKKQNHTKPFAYLVRYHSGDKDALKWITENDARLVAFVNWAKVYQLP